jgi:hypothetical protein
LRDDLISIGGSDFGCLEAVVAYWITDLIELPGFAALALEPLNRDLLADSQYAAWRSAIDEAETSVAVTGESLDLATLRSALRDASDLYARVADALRAPTSEDGRRLLKAVQEAGPGGTYRYLESGDWKALDNDAHRVGIRSIHRAHQRDSEGFVIDLGPISIFLDGATYTPILGDETLPDFVIGKPMNLQELGAADAAAARRWEFFFAGGRPFRLTD